MDFTIFIHHCGFWSLAPYFNETPIVLQHNKQDGLFVRQSWNQLPTIHIQTYHLFYYLKKERPKDLHVVSVNGPSISDTSDPSVQQLSGIYASFSLMWRHQQVTLNVALQVRVDTDPKTAAWVTTASVRWGWYSLNDVRAHHWTIFFWGNLTTTLAQVFVKPEKLTATVSSG